MDWVELFVYDNLTGYLHWKIRPNNRVKVGDVAGCLHHTGYVIVRACRQNFLAHRIVWDLNNPTDKLLRDEQIDHIDQDKTNNRLHNLRKVSSVENGRNRPKNINNTSGVVGVYWYSQYAKWRAQIVVAGKLVFLGYFDEKAQADSARRNAEIKFGFHENHGK